MSKEKSGKDEKAIHLYIVLDSRVICVMTLPQGLEQLV